MNLKLVNFRNDFYKVSVANDLKSRQEAYRVVYASYLKKGYIDANDSAMHSSYYDSLADTITLVLRNKNENIAGVVTLITDSSHGLPADNLYKDEIDTCRIAGKKVGELGSFAIVEENRNSIEVLAALAFSILYVAKDIKHLNYVVITVNPRHVYFYTHKLRFHVIGAEKNYEKVKGAPAVLLGLDLSILDNSNSLAGKRDFYKYNLKDSDRKVFIKNVKEQIKSITEEELNYFF